MAGINRYDVAQPAKDNYFNTFVPLPLDQLTALGMARQEELKRNQDILDKAYANAIDIKYIKDSPAEEAHYKDIVNNMNDIVSKYAAKDLSNVSIQSELRREMSNRVNPTLVKRLEESYGQWAQAQALKADLKSKGRWNDLLDEDPASQWDSAKQGTYKYLPEAYNGREELLEPYFKHLKPSYKGIDENGMMISGIDQRDLNRTVNERSSELLNTPAGRQEIKLFKKQYPDLAKGMKDIDIMNQIMSDYSEQYKVTDAQPLPSEYLKAYGIGANKGSDNLRPMTNFGKSTMTNFKSVQEVRSNINDLEKNNDIEAAKDLRYKLDKISNKYKLDEVQKRYEEAMKGNPTLTLAKAKLAFAGDKDGDIQDYNEVDQETIKKALNEINSSSGRKYAFGFTADQLSSMVDPVTGKKVGLQEFETLSSNILTQPLDYEIISINDKDRPKDGKIANALSTMRTQDLENVSIDILPNKDRDWKPVLTFGYANTKEGKTTHNTIKVAVNDETQQSLMADMMVERKNFEGAASIMNPIAAQSIMYDNVDQPVKYNIIAPNGVTTDVIFKRDPDDKSNFVISFPRRDPSTGTIAPFDIKVRSREEAIAQIYNVLGQNITMGRNNRPEYSRFSRTTSK